MNAGELHDRIIIERLDRTTSEWVEIADPVMRASVESQGAELYRVRIRYRHDLFGLKDTEPKLRILWDRGAGDPRVLFVDDVLETVRSREVTLMAAGRAVEEPVLPHGVVERRTWPE